MENKSYDVIVLGGGPAGLTAAIYLARGKMSVLVLNLGTVGGQMVLTHEIANYPGIESIPGFQLSRNMKAQAESFGAEIRSNIKITEMNISGAEKVVVVNNKERYSAKAVVLAPGGRSRTLNVPGEDTFKGRGISYCATCDGDFFQDKKVVVVGGGNSALEEAVALTKYARELTIIHQFDHFQAFEHAVTEVKKNPKISIILESEITEFIGGQKLDKIKYENQRSGEISEMDVDGVFVLIGYVPNTEAVKGIVELNEHSEIITDELMETNLPGVFAAGDARAKRYRQITTAVSDGTIAALSAMEYLNS
jgi:thioredoxin reductase (NADPH)